MNKKNFITIGVIAIIAIGVFVYLNKPDKNQGNSQLETVKVAQFGEALLYMPLYLANDKDFFLEEGIKIEITNTGGDDKTFAAVINGSATFGVADPIFAAIAKEQGLGGKVVASIVNGVPFWGVTKNHAIPEITNATQLRGYRVATFPSPSTAYTLQCDMFGKAGLKPNISQGAFGTLLAMLESGQADIALEFEPNVSIAVNQGAKVLYSLDDGDFAFTGVTVTDATIEKQPELVQRFVNALQKAATFAHTYPDSVAYFASKRFPDMNEEVVKNACKRMIETNLFPQNVIISTEAWDKAVELRQRVGDIKSVENVKSVLDMSFAEKALSNK